MNDEQGFTEGPTALGVDKVSPPIEVAYQQLLQKIKSLAEHVDMLQKRLQPLMSQEITTAEVDSNKLPEAYTLSQRLYVPILAIEAIENEIKGILTKLEL